MNIRPPMMASSYPRIRFGQEAPSAQSDPEAQENAVFAGSAKYDDGETTYYLAINDQTNTGTVYVKTTRLNAEQVLEEAPQKFTIPDGPTLTYKPYVEEDATN